MGIMQTSSPNFFYVGIFCNFVFIGFNYTLENNKGSREAMNPCTNEDLVMGKVDMVVEYLELLLYGLFF